MSILSIIFIRFWILPKYFSKYENNFEDLITDIKMQTKTFRSHFSRWKFIFSSFFLLFCLTPSRTEERNYFFFHGDFLGKRYYSQVYTYSTWLSKWRAFHHSVLSLNSDYHRVLLICLMYDDSEVRQLRVQLV